MFLFAVYCVGVFNACSGTFYTESSPMISSSIPSYEECQKRAIAQAKSLKAEHPSLDFHWKCIDYSEVKVIEDK